MSPYQLKEKLTKDFEVLFNEIAKYSLKGEEFDIIKNFRNLPPDKKEIFYNYLIFLYNQQKCKKEEVESQSGQSIQ